jgi:predicted GIY-YIG superfamily endonuclease
MLRCADGSLYTGIARDIGARLEQHRSGRYGAKYLRGRAPFELVFAQQVGDRGLSQRLEYRVKKLRRAQKIALISGELCLAQLLCQE